MINQSEVDSIVELVRSLCDMNPEINFATRIGIITPYNGQSKLLKRKFNAVFGSKILHYIDINTIDGFQGQEKDIVIFSCVRAHPKAGSIGFVADVRRMNVGITRARNSLFIVGHLSSLMKNEEWKSLIEDAKERKAIRDVKINDITIIMILLLLLLTLFIIYYLLFMCYYNKPIYIIYWISFNLFP